MLTHKRKQDPGIGPNLNVVVVPMLDMSFQLLFFLVITFKPSDAIEGKMDFNLPASGEARATQLQDVDPNTISDQDLALPAQFTVLVKTIRDGTDNEGNISAIIIKSQTGESAVPNLEALENFLRSKANDPAASNKDDIKIEAESRLKYTYVIEVMDACLRAGFTRVGFAPPPDLALQ
jgi:biopolymer transport protein ExbD